MIRLTVRSATPEDRAFIFATWLRNYQHSSHFARKIDQSVFFAHHHRVIENILDRLTTRTLIATPDGDENTIIGYLVFEYASPTDSDMPWDRDGRPVIHFAYTKKGFRGFGVFRELLKQSQMDLKNSLFSHWTTDVDALIHKWPGLTYVPYLSYEGIK